MPRTPLVALTAVLAALALSSCSAEDLVERAAEESIENSGGGEADIDFDADTGSFSVEGEGGSFSTGSSLPDDFPVDDIPLVDGQVVSAAASDEQGSRGYLVLMTVDASPEDAAAEASALLEGAGFTQAEEVVQMAGMATYQLTDDSYEVLVTAYDGGGSATLQYSVTSG